MMLMLYLLLFVGGSFLGYVFESVLDFFSGKSHKGFLPLPSRPIYGFGAIIAYLVFLSGYSVFNKVLIAGVLLILLELFTGMFFKKHYKPLWDYAHLPFDFKGMISLYASLMWFVIATILVVFVFPILDLERLVANNFVQVFTILQVIIISLFFVEKVRRVGL